MIRILAAVAAMLVLTTAVEAASFGCGRYQRGLFGLNGPQHRHLNLARGWLAFPRTSAQAGAVVVQGRRGRALGGGPGGHVARIERVTGSCTAIVRDNRGTYERDICRNLLAYVAPR